jgi:hypothetical protein
MPFAVITFPVRVLARHTTTCSETFAQRTALRDGTSSLYY